MGDNDDSSEEGEDSGDDQQDADPRDLTQQDMDSAETSGNPPHWHTFKYRPIFGIVPVGPAAGPFADEEDVPDDDDIDVPDEGNDDAAEDADQEDVMDVDIDLHAQVHKHGKAVTRGQRNGRRRLEVVLVERPLWDLDLPPKFAGEREMREGR